MSPQRFVAEVRRALSTSVPAGARLLVACSGGPDSTALLLALAALQGERDHALHVVYVDHGLRAAAATEGEQVRRLAAGLDLDAAVVPVRLAPGASLLGAAREARYAALAEAARRVGAQAVAVGHTRSDQAETLLMRLLGGAGPRGLGGMAPARALGPDLLLVRPLLGLDRADVLAFLAAAGVEAVDDPTNADPRHLRSRVRHELLPLLRRERPDLERHLGELAADLRADAACLDELGAAAFARLSDGPGLSVPGLRALPRALQVRVIGRLLGPASRRHLEAALALCERADGTQWLDLPGGRRLERRYDRLLLASGGAGGGTVGAAVPVPAPGAYTLDGVTVRVSLLPPGAAPPPPSPRVACFAGAQVGLPLLLRHPRPGDRLRLRCGRRKLSDLFIDVRVPRGRRAAQVLLCQGPEVLWVVGLRAAELGPAAGPDDAPALLAEWLDPAADSPT